MLLIRTGLIDTSAHSFAVASGVSLLCMYWQQSVLSSLLDALAASTTAIELLMLLLIQHHTTLCRYSMANLNITHSRFCSKFQTQTDNTLGKG